MSSRAARIVKLEQRIKPGDELDRWVSALTNDELRLTILDAAREVAGRADVEPEEAEKARADAIAIEQELAVSGEAEPSSLSGSHSGMC